MGYYTKILGKDYLLRTQNVEDIFGKFNSRIKDKLVVILNEMSGKDGFEKNNEIKNFVTLEEVSIEFKKQNPYKQKNFSRIIFLTNNMQPVNIQNTDRRFMVITGDYKVKKRSYYDELGKIIDNEEALISIYKHFINVDISEFETEDRPITKGYKQMKEINNNPLLNFLYEKYAKLDEEVHHVNLPTFFESYRKYLNDNGEYGYEVNHKNVTNVCISLEITKTVKKIKGVATRVFKIIPSKLKLILQGMNVQDEVVADEVVEKK